MHDVSRSLDAHRVVSHHQQFRCPNITHRGETEVLRIRLAPCTRSLHTHDTTYDIRHICGFYSLFSDVIERHHTHTQTHTRYTAHTHMMMLLPANNTPELKLSVYYSITTYMLMMMVGRLFFFRSRFDSP